MRSKKILDAVLTVVIVVVAAVALSGAIVYFATKNNPDNPTGLTYIVENSPQPTVTPTPTSRPDYEQEVIIDQDRTLKFDNIIKGTVGVNSGVATITVDDYAFAVDGMVVKKRVQKYEETEGFTCSNTDMLIVEDHASRVISTIDYAEMYVEEFYNTGTDYDSFIREECKFFPNLFDHEAEWKLPFKDYTTNDVPTDVKDWCISEDRNFQITGVGYMDFSSLGYEKAFVYQCYCTLNQSYSTVVYLKVSDNRFMLVRCDGNPINQIGYLTELIQNSLVVF